jgi:ABC-type spermidine/putrescine transport system permease subunit I
VSSARSSAAASPLSRVATLAIPSAWAAAVLLLPLAILVAMSLGSRPPPGGVVYDGSGQAWRWVAEKSETLLLPTAWRSARIAGIATLLSVLLATPVAWWIAGAPRRRRPLWLLLIVLPSWTSFVLRTYAWRFVFGNEGPVNGTLESLGMDTVQFLNTETAVVLGLVYAYLPFAVLPIYVAVERLDRDLLAAARDLGASPVRAFTSVALPLTMPGTAAAAGLVFVPCLAAFVTPRLLGGPKTYMLGQLVQDQFLTGRDWPRGAAVGVALVAVSLLVFLPLRRRGPAHA